MMAIVTYALAENMEARRSNMGTKGVLTTGLVREMFRHLQAFRDAYSDHGVDLITWDGVGWSLWDIEALYESSQTLLSPRQAQAIDLFLVQGMFESQAALVMGVSSTNPIGMYATDGINKLIRLVNDHRVAGYRPDSDRS